MTGETISHFRVAEKLGEGGMGAVYRAEDTLLRRTVALKFLKPSLVNDPTARARFLREAQAAAGLEHPNICPVYGFEEADGRAFIVMAFVEGAALARRMTEGFDVCQAVDWMIGICEGLKYAHRHGIVHRDIKAANVIVSDTGVPRITDFGLARIEDRSRITAPGSVLGTVDCMAPEQLLGEDADRRTDIWALGILFYEMIAGRNPFVRATAKETMRAIVEQPAPPLDLARRGLPPEVEMVIEKATVKSRAERYQHVDDMVADLRGLRRRLTPEQSSVALRAIPGEDAVTESIAAGSATRARAFRKRIAQAAVAFLLVLAALYVFWR